MPSSKAPWKIRAARPTDAALLAKFHCATPNVDWELETEHFVRHDLLPWAHAHHAKENDPRALLVLDGTSGELVAVCAHELKRLGQVGGEDAFFARWLVAVAVARSWQGKALGTAARASDVVMSAAMADIRARAGEAPLRIFGVVHKSNSRSLALCKRHGLICRMSDPPDPNYTRLVTG